MNNLSLVPTTINLDLGGAITSLYNVLFGGDFVSLQSEGELLKTQASKIQFLVKTIHKLYQDPKAAQYPTIQHLRGRDAPTTLVQVLVGAILSPETSDERSDNVQYALQCLAKVDPSIEAINREISLLCCTGSSEALWKEAHKNLLDFVNRDDKPLQVTIPLKAYPLPKNPCTYLEQCLYPSIRPGDKWVTQNRIMHDHFWRIKEIQIGALTPETQANFDNLKEIGSYECFETSSWNEFSLPWIRDVMLVKDNGEMLLPSRFSYQEGILPKMVRMLCEDPEAPLMGVVGGIRSTEILSRLKGAKEVPFCFEGGNFCRAVNTNGQQIYLCGGQNLLFSLLNSSTTFKGQKQRLLKKIKFLETRKFFADEAVEFIRKRWNKTWLIDSFSKEEQVWITKLSIAGLACIQEMMEQELDHPVLVVGDAFISQPAFHLDMFLAPAPEGVIFLQDHSLVEELVKNILGAHSLSQEEKSRLRVYQHFAHEQEQLVGKKLKSIEKQLRNAGFKVIRVPAVFHEESDQLAAHFLNGLFSKGKKGTFFITNGSTHPVDKYLREAFACLMKSYGIDRVYFTGRPTTGEISSRGGLEYFPAQEGLQNSGGIHCRTQEFNALFKGDLKKDAESEQVIPASESVNLEKRLFQFFKYMLHISKQKT